MLLNRSAILAASDLPFEDLPVPEWSGTVRVAAITAAQRDDFEGSLREKKANGESVFSQKQIRAKLCALAIVDESGKPLFDEDDIEELGGKSAAALDRVYECACRLAGMDRRDRETIEKN